MSFPAARPPGLAPAIALGIAIGIAIGSGAATGPARAGEFGVLAGINLANLGGDADQFGHAIARELQGQFGGSWTSDKSAKSGFALGTYYATKISDNLALQSELHYTQRGTEYSISGFSSGYRISLKEQLQLNYFEMPLLLRTTFPTSTSVIPAVWFGPQLGLRSSARIKVSAVGPAGAGASNSADITELINAGTLGAVFGAGLGVLLGPSAVLSFQARYVVGLVNALDDSSLSMKSRDLGLYVGFSFLDGVLD